MPFFGKKNNSSSKFPVSATTFPADSGQVDTKDYHGCQLFTAECDALYDIERLLKKPIPKVVQTEWNLLGFSAKNGHVSELGLNFQGLLSLPDSIWQLTSLNVLELNHNKLSSLSDEIGNLKLLKILSIANNQLSSLPETIGQLRLLQTFILLSNQISSLPDTIANLKSVSYLDLCDNRLSFLPDTIGALSALKSLLLLKNQLTSIPEVIGQIRVLQELLLGSNQITILPEIVGIIKSLQILCLEDNPITILPKTFENLTSLKKLRLSKTLAHDPVVQSLQTRGVPIEIMETPTKSAEIKSAPKPVPKPVVLMPNDIQGKRKEKIQIDINSGEYLLSKLSPVSREVASRFFKRFKLTPNEYSNSLQLFANFRSYSLSTKGAQQYVWYLDIEPSEGKNTAIYVHIDDVVYPVGVLICKLESGELLGRYKNLKSELKLD